MLSGVKNRIVAAIARDISSSAAVFAICCFIFSVTAKSGAQVSGKTPIFVELFTSEGCSSCPPADKYIATLDTIQPIPSAQFIVLSEHVTYFNHEGWIDPYSLQSITERQDAYVHAMHLKEPYTPQVIVNGDRVLPLDDAPKARDIFEEATTTHTVPIVLSPVMANAADKKRFRLHVSIVGSAVQKPAGVYVAVALNHAKSFVGAGENEGRSLSHVAVLQSMTKVGEVKPGEPFSREISVKVQTKNAAQATRLIVFIQTPGPGKVLGAAMMAVH